MINYLSAQHLGFRTSTTSSCLLFLLRLWVYMCNCSRPLDAILSDGLDMTSCLGVVCVVQLWILLLTNNTIPTINVFSVQYKKTIMCLPYYDPLALPEYTNCAVIFGRPGLQPWWPYYCLVSTSGATRQDDLLVTQYYKHAKELLCLNPGKKQLRGSCNAHPNNQSHRWPLCFIYSYASFVT